MTSTQTHGLKLHEYGDANQPALLLLHGAGGLHRQWLAQIEGLQDRYYLLAPDLWLDNQDFSIPRLSEALSAGLKEKGIETLFVLGMDFGASVAIQFALEHPQRVKGLILSGARYQHDSFDLFLSWALNLMPEKRLLGNFVKATAEHNPLIAQAMAEDLARLGKSGFIGMLKAMRKIDFKARYGELKMPVEIWVGEYDRPNFIQEASDLHQAIGQASLRIISEVGHGWQIEDPTLFNQLVDKVLSQIESGQWVPVQEALQPPHSHNELE
ncbi:alpha/beta hydrolase [Anaerolineales bacterium]